MAKQIGHDKLVVGIDQSYNRTGICVMLNGNILKTYSVDFKQCKTNTDKRLELENTLQAIYDDYIDDAVTNIYKDVLIICERIRLKSQGFINESYIKATGALIATIIDFFYTYEIPVYSVDTRAWKSAIIGTSKPLNNPYGINPNKYPTILYLKHKGLLEYIVEAYSGRGKKGIIQVKQNGKKVRCKINDDVADSICIAMYGFLPKQKQKLKGENF